MICPVFPAGSSHSTWPPSPTPGLAGIVGFVRRNLLLSSIVVAVAFLVEGPSRSRAVLLAFVVSSALIALRCSWGGVGFLRLAQGHPALERNLPKYPRYPRHDSRAFRHRRPFYGHEGNGPLHGPARQLGYVVMADDPVAADFICARIMGINPHAVPHLNTAAQFPG